MNIRNNVVVLASILLASSAFAGQVLRCSPVDKTALDGGSLSIDLTKNVMVASEELWGMGGETVSLGHKNVGTGMVLFGKNASGDSIKFFVPAEALGKASGAVKVKMSLTVETDEANVNQNLDLVCKSISQ